MKTPPSIAALSAVKLSLMIGRLRDRSGVMDLRNSEPIAITGMACRLPGGVDDPDSFWELLRSGKDAVTEVPRERWDVDAYYSTNPEAHGKSTTRWGAFLSCIDAFDAEFFNISPREALSMDPQQRIALELAWRVLENAGEAPDRLAGSQTGVFLGICTNDYGQMMRDLTRIDPYFGTGNNASVAAGRVSYWLGLQGPALAVDTACSSSLEAVHLACQSLRAGECNMAIAGGVNLILRPDGMIYFSKLQAMARDGRCKTFAASADGYVRGEGAAMVLLKRLPDAIAAGDRIHALIRGTASNQDGRSNGLTAPNGRAQEAVIRQALANGCVAAEQVSYVECHGTGTPLGDPIEVEALARVLGGERKTPLWIGSLKTNMGHLEATAGIAGLVKTVLSLQHRQIPPHLHFNAPNPHILWSEIPVAVATALTPWESERRFAGVSSFGFSGTNVHAVLEEAPGIPTAEPVQMPVCILPVSARCEKALESLIADFAPHARDPNVCAAAARRRSHHEHRAVLIQGEESARGVQSPGQASPVIFIVPGQGSQWRGMGKDLLRRSPVFLETYKQCSQVLDLVEGLDADPEQLPVDRIQPLLFAVEVSLAAVWKDWGIAPDAIVGHSMGEVAAACLADALDLEDAARIIIERSRIIREMGRPGAMALTDLTLDEAELEITEFPDALFIAACNGPRSTVLSGDPDAVRAAVSRMTDRGRFARQVKVDYASHSPHMEPLAPLLSQRLRGIRCRETKIPLYSSVTGERIDGRQLTGDYWGRNLCSRVRFWQVIEKLGAGICIELSPHPILHGLPSLQRERPDLETMLASLGALYCGGRDIDWSRVVPAAPVVDMPLYPFQRRRYWMKSNPVPSDSGAHPLLGAKTELATGEVVWQSRAGTPAFLKDHRVDGAAVMPAAAYIEMALAAAADLGGLSIAEMRFVGLLFLKDDGVVDLQTVYRPDGTLRIFSRADNDWQEHAVASLFRDFSVPGKAFPVPVCELAMDTADYYEAARTSGVDLGDSFRGIARLWRGAQGARSELKPLGRHADLADYFCHPAVLDCGLQTLAVAAIKDESTGPFVPVRVGAVRVFGRPLIAAQVVDATTNGEIVFRDESGDPVLALEEMRFAPVDARRLDRWLYRPEWIEQPLTRGNRPMSVPVVFRVQQAADPLALCMELLRMVREAKSRLYVVAPEGAVWGFGRTIALEHPELQCTLIDPGENSSEASHVEDEIAANDPAQQVRYRQGRRYVHRTARMQCPPLASIRFRADAAYLITGGSGALGTLTAQWMAEHGAGTIVLVSRSGIEAPAAAGSSFVARRADVTDRAAMAVIIDEFPNLRGVIYAAGVMDDVTLSRMKAQHLASVFAPKVTGSEILHDLTKQRELDFFVLYSSASGVLGAPGQANYAAANAHLDALARRRRAEGLPALSIDWAAWSDIGLAAEKNNRSLRLESRGMASIPPVLGLEALGRLLQMDVEQVAVLPFDPSELVRNDEGGAAIPRTRTEMETEIARHIAEVAGLGKRRIDANAPLGKLGIDSLMALEIRNRLQRLTGAALPATFVFRFRTVAAIAEHLMPNAPSAISTPSTSRPAMSTEDIADILERELARLGD